jgi:uncharacterized protein (TIRG00374 family)
MNRLADRRILLRLAITVALFAVLFWRIDLEAAGLALREANYLFVLPAMVSFGVAKLLVTVRWRMMMGAHPRISIPPLFGILSVANLANNILPARLGDLVRVQVPAQRYGISRARGIATVFATESLLDGIALGVLGMIGLALIDIPGFPTEVFWVVLGLLAGCVVAVVPLSHLKLEPGWTERTMLRELPPRSRSLAEGAVPHFLDGLVVFRHARLGFKALGLSFALWLIEVGVFALLGMAFDITLSMPAWMLVMISANLITAVPITPSNIGAYEVAITELLKALGVEAGAAAAFAISAHVFNILWISGVGLVSMWALKLTFDDVFSLGANSEAGRDEVPEAAGAAS